MSQATRMKYSSLLSYYREPAADIKHHVTHTKSDISRAKSVLANLSDVISTGSVISVQRVPMISREL